MRGIYTTLIVSLFCIYASAQINRAKYDYVNNKTKYGFVDANDRWIVPPIYENTYWHDDWKHGQFQTAKASGSWGLLDETGKIIFQPGKYTSYYVTKGFIELKDVSNKVGLATIEGKIIVPCTYSKLYVSEEYIKVTDFQNRVGLLTKEGKSWVPCKYKEIFVSTLDSSLRPEVTDFVGNIGSVAIVRG